MVPCVDDACSDMFAFWCRLLDARSFANVDGKLRLGPRNDLSSHCSRKNGVLDL